MKEVGKPDVSERATGVLANIRKYNAPLPQDIQLLAKACPLFLHATAWMGVFLCCVCSRLRRVRWLHDRGCRNRL